MKKIVIFVLTLFVLVILISGCTDKAEPITQPASETAVTVKGVTLTPKSFQSADFTDFFQKAGQAGQIISWAGDWNEISNTNNGGAKVLAELSSTYHYIPLIEAQFFNQASGKLLRPLDQATKQKYKEAAVAFAQKYKPRYFALGIEVNVLYEKSSEDFNDFVSFYNNVYDAIKTASPETKVFTIFQLEKLKGLHGGLFGGENGAAEWQLLDKFSKADLVAFTTYPDLIYKSPNEIPSDYYAEISAHTSKPVAFTEIGWHSKASPAGWESSEAEQVEFIDIFFKQAKGISPEFTIWSFMYDQNTAEPFNSMGLFNSDGSAKTAWTVWTAGK